MDSKTVRRLLIAALILVAAVLLFVAACAVVEDLSTPRAIGEISYEPIESLPPGISAIHLTAEDVIQHPAFAVIFNEENTEYAITMILDANATRNPTPSIEEREGHIIIDNYPFVEYKGQLYRGVMAIS